ncbi:uncharacterized protein LOC124613809 [Schistocerca americana]|uniref:uncharacterized protein LOC124613809 n=1 Tax=Schistocerca americana TaxID=7009 RepID=UPI001F4F33F4|nr:uncharacterized protein LOC124613809 [Schistocerca americana]
MTLCLWLYRNDVLCSEQHVFRNKRSTTTAIYEYIKSILSLMDKKQELTGVFIELSKGFDMVDHKILLSILETYGIQDFKGSKYGVPQGSVVGPPSVPSVYKQSQLKCGCT